MKPNQIFETENTIGIWDKDDREFVEGICVAQSALWCRNILQGKRDLLSKPDYALAGPLQAIYEIRHKCEYTPFLRSMGMKIDAETEVGGYSAMEYLKKNDGQYMLRYPGHAMGAKVSGSNYYFFDPEDGLFKYPNGDAMVRRIMKDYYDEMGENWTLRKISLA